MPDAKIFRNGNGIRVNLFHKFLLKIYLLYFEKKKYNGFYINGDDIY